MIWINVWDFGVVFIDSDLYIVNLKIKVFGFYFLYVWIFVWFVFYCCNFYVCVCGEDLELDDDWCIIEKRVEVK